MKTVFKFLSSSNKVQSVVKVLPAILMIAFATGAYAQNTFFPTQAGMTLVYVQKNAKGNPEGYSRLTIKDVEGSGNNMSISYVMEILDKNKKPSDPPIEMPCKVVIKDGVMILDMSQMFANMQKTGLKAEISGMPMELPNNLQPGQSLKDADVTMTMDMGIMKMKATIKMTDGKCLAIEDVTVPAGTFTCHKLTQTVTTTIMGRNSVGRTVSWYAPGIGTVKTESYNDKDKLQNSMELAEKN